MPSPEVALPPVLLAAGLDWLEGLLPVLFVLFWLVSQVVNVIRRMAGDPHSEHSSAGQSPPAPAEPVTGRASTQLASHPPQDPPAGLPSGWAHKSSVHSGD